MRLCACRHRPQLLLSAPTHLLSRCSDTALWSAASWEPGLTHGLRSGPPFGMPLPRAPSCRRVPSVVLRCSSGAAPKALLLSDPALPLGRRILTDPPPVLPKPIPGSIRRPCACPCRRGSPRPEGSVGPELKPDHPEQGHRLTLDKTANPSHPTCSRSPWHLAPALPWS